MDNASILAQILKDKPEFQIMSQDKLYQAIRDNTDHRITHKTIKEYFKNRELTQIYKKPTNNYKYKITGPPRSFQLDVILLPDFKGTNNGIYQFLMLIDIQSRKIFMYPLMSGKLNDILDSYENFIVEQGNEGDDKIRFVQGDDFFNSKIFQAYNQELDIVVITGVAEDDHMGYGLGGNRLGIVDRATRTIKNLIQKYMLQHKTTTWTKWYSKIIDIYNNSYHSTIKATPNEVYDDIDYAKIQFENQVKYNATVKKEVDKDIPMYSTVRILLPKKTFEKEKPSWSKEFYKISEKIGFNYILEDAKGNALKRIYRPSEIQVVGDVIDEVSTKQIEKGKSRSKHVRKILKSKMVDNVKEAEQMVDKKGTVRVKRIIKKPKRFAE